MEVCELTVSSGRGGKGRSARDGPVQREDVDDGGLQLTQDQHQLHRKHTRHYSADPLLAQAPTLPCVGDEGSPLEGPLTALPVPSPGTWRILGRS